MMEMGGGGEVGFGLGVAPAQLMDVAGSAGWLTVGIQASADANRTCVHIDAAFLDIALEETIGSERL